METEGSGRGYSEEEWDKYVDTFKRKYEFVGDDRPRGFYREQFGLDEWPDEWDERERYDRDEIQDLILRVRESARGRGDVASPDGDVLRFVYFILEPMSGSIKIGSTGSVLSRFRKIQSSCPSRLLLVGSIEGGYQAEFMIHGRFCDNRIRGEWFKADEKLCDFINLALGAIGLSEYGRRYHGRQRAS